MVAMRGVIGGGGLALFLIPLVAANGVGSAECGALGFGPSLLCSACAKLGDAVGAKDPLVGECLGCCAEDAVAKKYARAVLEVCK
jgi:hypothetical protein